MSHESDPGRSEQSGMSSPVIIGDATLYLGDCREILPSLPLISALLCDPPYGMDYVSNHNTGRKGVGAKMIRKDGDHKPIHGDQKPFDPTHLLALNVPSILWGANYYADRLPPEKQWLVWDKLASKAPVPSSSDVELAWTNLGGPARIFTHLWRGIMRAGEENVANGGKLHPNQKPVALMQWCLLQLAPQGPVGDFYMGSGTVGIACLRAGLPYIGVELEPAYFDIACQRIEDAQRQQRLLP